jgi:predicted transcriptional regulator
VNIEHESSSKADLSEIRYSELKNGAKGIALGQEDRFIEVIRKSKAWKLRIVDLAADRLLTAWTTIHDLEDLRSGYKAKAIRAHLSNQTIERALIELQEHEGEWNEHEGDTAETEEASPEIIQYAEELLKDPKMLYRVKKSLDKWVVSEDRSKLLQFILSLSCKSKKDYAFQIVISESAGGKSWKTHHVLSYLPKEWYRIVGRLTRTALEYLKNQDFDLLWIQERRGGKEASNSIRLSSVEDGGTKIWVTERNPETGRFETHEYEVPGRSVVTTTTNPNIDAQDLTRSWLLGVDESPRQTANIIDYQADEAAQPLEFKESLGLSDPDFRPIVHEALRQLEFDYVVIIPFAEELKRFVNTQVLRTRRDFKKLIRLIRVVTLLHQKQRLAFPMKDRRFLVSLPQDAYIALALAWEDFRRTAMGLDQREQRVLEALKLSGEQTRREVAQACSRSMTWAENMLKSLVDKGYVDEDTSCKAYRYMLRFEPEKNPEDVTLPDTDTLEVLELENKVKSFLSRSCITDTLEGTPSFAEYVNPITGETYTSPTTLTLTHDKSEQAAGSVDEKKPVDISVSDSDRLKRSIPQAPTQVTLEDAPFKPENVLQLERITSNVQDKCVTCGFSGRMDWQITFNDGSWGTLCDKCGLRLEEKLGAVEK